MLRGGVGIGIPQLGVNETEGRLRMRRLLVRWPLTPCGGWSRCRNMVILWQAPARLFPVVREIQMTGADLRPRTYC